MPDPAFPTSELERFLALLQRVLAEGGLARLVLSKPRSGGDDLQRVSVREVVLQGESQLSFVYQHRTRDVTRNCTRAAGLAQIRELLENRFDHAHLLGAAEELQLRISRRGKAMLIRSAREHAVPAPAHDREKQRPVDITRPWLVELGVTDAQHRVIPALARKWKQINKFVEVFDHAFAASGLGSKAGVRVVDFGSGKGYLTFAVHDHLSHALGLRAAVTGVELREDLVQLCNRAARHAEPGLAFVHGDVRSHAPGALDVMIALHACDTATDHAIHAGLRAGAAIIMCSPCCHKQIRPQMRIPEAQRPLLQHGIHLGQQAEMLTDALRALLLEAHGYDTRVFEFVSLEHTSKNKMILAVRRGAPGIEAAAAQAQVQALKDYYGVREHCLETLLEADREALAAATGAERASAS